MRQKYKFMAFNNIFCVHTQHWVWAWLSQFPGIFGTCKKSITPTHGSFYNPFLPINIGLCVTCPNCYPFPGSTAAIFGPFSVSGTFCLNSCSNAENALSHVKQRQILGPGLQGATCQVEMDNPRSLRVSSVVPSVTNIVFQECGLPSSDHCQFGDWEEIGRPFECYIYFFPHSGYFFLHPGLLWIFYVFE